MTTRRVASIPLTMITGFIAAILGALGATAASDETDWAQAFEKAKRESPGFAVESVEEFRKLTDHYASLLSDGVTIRSFELPSGDQIRCVEVSSQRSLAASGHPLQPAPGTLPAGDTVTTPKRPGSSIDRPGAEFGLDGTKDVAGNERACPVQTFPKLIPRLENLYHFRRLEDLFQKTPAGGGGQSATPSSSVGLDRNALAAAVHEYAHAYQWVNNIGMSADFNLWSPAVERSDEFSLSQLWVARGLTTDNSLQTAETGWQVSQQGYGDAKAHLFIYYTTGNYQTGTGCYNLSCTGFVQTDNSVVLGESWTTYSTQGGPQYSISLAYYRDTTPPHNWWLKYGNTWVGYYPNLLFDSQGIANYSDEIDFGGEIVNDSIGGLHSTTAMGSGRFPSEGFGAAAFTKKIQYWDTSATQFDATGLNRVVTNASYYDLSLESSADSNWLRYFYFGGPGRVASSAPTASFTFSANPKAGQPMQFTDTSAGSPTSWSWTFGDGGASTAQNPTHTFGTGTYQVSLTVSNSGGSNTITQAIVVVSGEGGNLSVNVSVNPNPATVNQTVTFSCNVSGGSPPYTYQWRSPSTSSFVAGTSPTFSTLSSTPTSIDAGCTASDSVGASNASAATVQIIAGAATCVDFHLVDDATQLAIPLSANFLGQFFSVQTGQRIRFVATTQATFTSLSWTFGDGGTGSGNNFVYSYSTSGTVTATVTVDGSAACSKSYIFQVAGPPEPPKWFVAGLAYTQGAAAGTVWQSDLTILNPHPTLSATYSLAFLDGKNPIAPKDLVWKTVTLGAQQSVSASNVVGSFFGKSLGSWGAVILRGDVAPAAPAITSRTYNNGDPVKGTFGLSVPTTQATSGVSQQSSATQQFLIGLRDDAVAYTNIGLVNLISTDWSHAHLTFFDATGANIGVLSVDVPPYGVTQLNKPLTNGLGRQPLALYRVQVTVDSGGAVYPYATVIDQTSTDPFVVTTTEQPLNTYQIPGIVRVAGANNTVWRSRFVLHNPSTSARKVSVLYSYVPCDATGCGERRVSSGPGDLTMAVGETKKWDDFPAAWLSAAGGESVSDSVSYGNSYIDVAPGSGDPNQDPLLVLGETYNSQPTGPVGLQLSGFTDLDGGSKAGSNKRLLLTGLASNAGFRTNVALFLTSGTSGSFNVRVLSNTGLTLKTFGWSLAGSSPFIQFSDSDLFGGVNTTEGMSIIVDSFDGSPVAAYATIIDNTSGDATFVKAQPAP